MTKLAHTHQDGGECLACDVEEIRERIPWQGMKQTKMGAALDRIEAALADRAHLEEGARLMSASHELGLVRHSAYGAALDRWLEAERARKGTKG